MALTWRNVDAPDFSPSLQGYRTFSDLLGNAFGGLQSGLRSYDQTVSNRVNTALQLKLAAAQDPDAAKTIIAQMGSDPNAYRISAPTIQMAEARPGELITQAMNQENLSNTLYRDARVRGFDAAEDAAAPMVSDYLSAAAQGNGGDWTAANPGFGQGLSLAARTSLYTGGQDARRTAVGIQGAELGNAGTVISNEASRFSLDQSKENQRAQDDANNFIAKYRESGHNGDDLDGAIATAGLSGKAAMMVYGAIGGGMGASPGSGSNGMSGGGFGTGGGGAGGVSPGLAGSASANGGDPTRIFNYEARGAGYAAVPDSVQTLGQFVDYAHNMNVAGVKSSAAGLYQIVGKTAAAIAPSVLGSNWREAPYNAATQDKLGSGIFNWSKGQKNPVSALQSQWGWLSDQQASALLQMPWEQARGVISQHESGVSDPSLVINRPSPAGLVIGNVLANQGAANQQMQANANSIAVAIQPALGSNKSMLETVQGLTGKGGALAGANPDWVSRQLDSIMASAKSGPHPIQLNPEAAAVVLQRAARPKSTGWFTRPDMLDSNALGGNLEVNPDAVKSYVGQLTSADYQKTVVGNANIQLRNQQIEVAKAQWDAARARLVAAQQRAANNPSFDKSILGRLNMEELQAAQAYQQANAGQYLSAQAAGGTGPTLARPAPAPPPAPARVAARRPAPPVVRPAAPAPLAPSQAAQWLAAAAASGRGVPPLLAANPPAGPVPNNLMRYYLNTPPGSVQR